MRVEIRSKLRTNECKLKSVRRRFRSFNVMYRIGQHLVLRSDILGFMLPHFLRRNDIIPLPSEIRLRVSFTDRTAA